MSRIGAFKNMLCFGLQFFLDFLQFLIIFRIQSCTTVQFCSSYGERQVFYVPHINKELLVVLSGNNLRSYSFRSKRGIR